MYVGTLFIPPNPRDFKAHRSSPSYTANPFMRVLRGLGTTASGETLFDRRPRCRSWSGAVGPLQPCSPWRAAIICLQAGLQGTLINDDLTENFRWDTGLYVDTNKSGGLQFDLSLLCWSVVAKNRGGDLAKGVVCAGSVGFLCT